MDKFINSLEDENFDIDGFVSHVAVHAEQVSDLEHSFPSMTTTEKEEINAVWQSKLNKFLNCKNECKLKGTKDEICNQYSVDFFNFTFSMYAFLLLCVLVLNIKVFEFRPKQS
jgi:hypothetical protein